MFKIRKILVMSVFSLLYLNITITITNANSFTLNENDRFGCRASGGGYVLTIKKKYSDNYFVLENKIRGRKDLMFASFGGDSLEFITIDEKKNLTTHLFTLEDDKYIDFWFLVSLTKEEIKSLDKYKSYFDYPRKNPPKFSEEQLQNEIEVHNHRVSIIGDIMNSKEKLEKQGLATHTTYCRKRN